MHESDREDIDQGQDGEENWILAEIVHHLPGSNKYEVDDIDAEEGKESVINLFPIYTHSTQSRVLANIALVDRIRC